MRMDQTEMNNALQISAFKGDIESVQQLIDQGADADGRGGRYGSALYSAILRKHVDIATLLLNNGADVNVSGDELEPPLLHAAQSANSEMVQLLLDRGADINAKGVNYHDALHAASFGSDISTLRLLLDRKPVAEWSGNALLGSAYYWNTEFAGLLLNEGMDPNITIEQFGYPLQAAAYYGCRELMDLLLERRADVNAKGGDFSTALQAAAYYSNNYMIEMDFVRALPVDESVEEYRRGYGLDGEGHEDVLGLLLDSGADVNILGGRYGSALQAAVCHGSRRTVEFLVNRGADVNAQGGRFGSPLRAAMIRGDIALQQMLLKSGARPIDSTNRQSTDDGCVLCNLPLLNANIPEHKGMEGDIVWCKSKCGENFHAKCLAGRSKEADDIHGDLTCPACLEYWWYY